MIIRFTCPKCQQKHTVNEEMAGKAVACPCGQKLKLPSASGNSEAPQADPAEQPTDPAQGYSGDASGWGNAAYGDPYQGYGQQYPQGYDQAAQGGWYGGNYDPSYGYGAAGQGGTPDYGAYGNYPQAGGYGGYPAPGQPGYDPSAGFNPYAGYDQYGGQGQYGGYGYGGYDYTGQPAPGGYPQQGGYPPQGGYAGTPGYDAQGYSGAPVQPAGPPADAASQPAASQPAAAQAATPGTVTVQLQVNRRMLLGGVALLVVAFGVGGYLAMRPAPQVEVAKADEKETAKAETDSQPKQPAQQETKQPEQPAQQPQPTEPQPQPASQQPAAQTSTQPMPPGPTPMSPATASTTPAASTPNTPAPPTTPRTPSPTPAQPASAPTSSAAAVAAVDNEPRHHRLGPRVQVGPYSFSPPDATVCAGRGSRASNVKVDYVYYGSGPGYTGRFMRGVPLIKFQAQVEYRSGVEPLSYLAGIAKKLATNPFHFMFRQRLGSPQAVSVNGLNFIGHRYETAAGRMVRKGIAFVHVAPDHVLTVLGMCEDRENEGWPQLLELSLQTFKLGDPPAQPNALTSTELKQLHTSTAARRSSEPVDLGPQQHLFHKTDLQPDPGLLAKLGPDERFGSFVLRRPANLQQETAQVLTCDHAWIYRRPGTDPKHYSLGIYLFHQPRQSLKEHLIEAPFITLANLQYGYLDRISNVSRFETGNPNGLDLYTQSGTLKSKEGDSTLVYYTAIHRNQVVYVIGIARDRDDLLLLDTVGRSLRVAKPDEALPAPHPSNTPPELKTSGDYGPVFSEREQPLTIDLRRLDSLHPAERFGLFAVRRPKSMHQVYTSPTPTMPGRELRDVWVWAEQKDNRHLILQNTMCVTVNHRPMRAGLDPSGMMAATEHINSAHSKWNTKQSGRTTLNGLQIHYAIGEFDGPDLLSPSGEVICVSCYHEGCVVSVAMTSLDRMKSPETNNLLRAALVSLRLAKPDEALPTPLRSVDLEPAAQ